jgi:hypothetical protein
LSLGTLQNGALDKTDLKLHVNSNDSTTWCLFRAVVQNLAGGKLEVSMDVNPRTTTILELKCYITSHWKIPPAFQQLVYEMAVLDNRDLLASVIQLDGSVPTISMALILNAVYEALSDDEVLLRGFAVKQLAKTASQGDEKALAALLSSSSDLDGEVRREAITSLIAVADTGNERALAAILKRTKDQYIGVRLAVLRFLTQRSLRGQDHIMALVSACVEDGDVLVRAEALEHLVQVVTHKHYDRVVLVLGERVGHRDEFVRSAAEEALETLAKRLGEKRASGNEKRPSGKFGGA